MSELRQEKVAAEIKRILAAIIQHDIKDPRVCGITLTHVKVSPDFSICHIQWLASPQSPRAEIAKGLEAASSFLRRSLAAQMDLRHTPKLVFHYDEAIEKAQHMDKLLSDLRQSGQMGTE